MQERRQAAHAVAALLDLAAVGVEDAVVSLRAGAARRLDHQGLVEADAGVTRGQRAPLRGGRQPAVARRIENDEIVAEAVHLGELELHGAEEYHYDSAPACASLPGSLPRWCCSRSGGCIRNATSTHQPGVLAAAEPPQQRHRRRRGIERGDFTLRPRAGVQRDGAHPARARTIPSGDLASWCPRISRWAGGRCPTARVLQDIEISQGNRFYYWRTESWPMTRGEIESAFGQLARDPGQRGGARGARHVCASAASSSCAGQLVDIEGQRRRHDDLAVAA